MSTPSPVTNAPVTPPLGRRWTTGDVAAYAQIVIAAAVLLVLVYVAQKVLITLLIAILLAVLLEPVVALLERVRIPRPLGAFLAVMATLALCYGVANASYNRASDFIANLPKYTTQFRQTVLRFRRQAQQLQKTTETMFTTPEPPGTPRPLAVYPSLTWSEAMTRIVGPLTEFLLFLSTIPFLAYFMLSWKRHLRAATVGLFAESQRRAAVVTLGEIANMIRAFIAGNLLIGMLIGACSTIVFGLLGLPSFVVVGLISGLVSLVPYLGAVLAIVPPLLVGAGQLSRAEVGILVGTAFGLHVSAFNVLYPKLLGPRLELNPLAVTMGLLVWGWLWGGLGLIFALPLTAVMKIVCDHIPALEPIGVWLGESGGAEPAGSA